MGMGRMYGPISPPTNAMGKMAAITAQVANTVGLPTSITASTATLVMERPRFIDSFICLTIFSTTTMASSTRIPMEKIRANSVILLSV